MKDVQQLENEIMNDQTAGRAFARAMDLGNLGVIAPHKAKYYEKYNMQWLEERVDRGEKLEFVTFWKVDQGWENAFFSQWYQGKPFFINGREYYTAEQYMMSEKALMFKDYKIYDQIMRTKDPAECKRLGKQVDMDVNDRKRWGRAAREVLWHGNLGKFQGDIELVDALLSTEQAVLVEASPKDAIYGSGIAKEDLLNPDGSLKVHPRDWHTSDNHDIHAENKLGFVLMGIRDLFRDLMKMDRDEKYNE